MLESSPPLRKVETGHVGDEVGGHRRLDDLAQVGRWPGRGLGRDLGDRPVPVHGRAAVGPELDPGAGRQLLDALDGAALRRDPVVEERRDEGARIGLHALTDRADDALQLGGEDDAVLAGQVVQRLDAELVAGEHQRAGALVEDGEGEHAAEAGEGVGAPVPPGLEDDLGVRGRVEADAVGHQLGPQVAVVVELAVVAERQPVPADRLVAAGREVDDRESAVGELARRSGRAGTRRGRRRPGRGGPVDRSSSGRVTPRPPAGSTRRCRTSQAVLPVRSSKTRT